MSVWSLTHCSLQSKLSIFSKQKYSYVNNLSKPFSATEGVGKRLRQLTWTRSVYKTKFWIRNSELGLRCTQIYKKQTDSIPLSFRVALMLLSSSIATRKLAHNGCGRNLKEQTLRITEFSQSALSRLQDVVNSVQTAAEKAQSSCYTRLSCLIGVNWSLNLLSIRLDLHKVHEAGNGIWTWPA